MTEPMEFIFNGMFSAVMKNDQQRLLTFKGFFWISHRNLYRELTITAPSMYEHPQSALLLETI